MMVRAPRAHHSLPEHGREIRREAQALATSLESAAIGLRDAMTEGLRDHPYRTLGIAAAAGFVVGRGGATRLTRLALVTAVRLAMALAMQRVSAGVEAALRPGRAESRSSLPPATRSI